MKVVDKGSAAPSCSPHIELAVWPNSSRRGGGCGIPEDRRPFWSHCQRNENFSESLYDLPSPAPPLQNSAGRCGFYALLTDLMQRENGGLKQGSSVGEAEDKAQLWGRVERGGGGGDGGLWGMEEG